MSVTLRQIAALVIGDLSGGDKSADSPYDEREVILRARGKVAYVCKAQWWENYAEGDRNIPKMFIYTFENIAVAKNMNNKYATVLLPEYPIVLPHNKGIYEVCPQSDIYDPYIRRNNQGVTRHTRSGDLQGKAGWWSENRVIVLYPKDKVGTKVAVKLVLPAPSALGVDDMLPLAPEMISQVVEELKKEIASQVIQDTINDDNKDIGVNGKQ